jgi:hypothetical protein
MITKLRQMVQLRRTLILVCPAMPCLDKENRNTKKKY